MIWFLRSSDVKNLDVKEEKISETANQQEDDEIIQNMNSIKETIRGIKVMIENVIKNSTVDIVNIQLKNANLLLNNVNEDINKNNEKIKNLIKDNTFTNYYENKNVIRGTINISSNEINKLILLFNTDINNNIDVNINNKKVNVIKENDEWKYNFTKEGNYIFEIILIVILNVTIKFIRNKLFIF